MFKDLINNIKRKTQTREEIYDRRLLFWGTYKDYAIEDIRYEWTHYDCFEAKVNKLTNEITGFTRITNNEKQEDCIILDDRIIDDKKTYFDKSFIIKCGDIVFTVSPIPMNSLNTDIKSNNLTIRQIEAITQQRNSDSQDRCKLRAQEKGRELL